MHTKSFLAYTSIVTVLTAISSAPVLAGEAHKTKTMAGNQSLSASSSYAYAPQTAVSTSRHGRCWIQTDANRPYGYVDSCANPLAYDPTLDPTYNASLEGD